jgi:hypothetical protein
MLMALAGFTVPEMAGDLVVMTGYTAIVSIIAWMVFDIIWHD